MRQIGDELPRNSVYVKIFFFYGTDSLLSTLRDKTLSLNTFNRKLKRICPESDEHNPVPRDVAVMQTVRTYLLVYSHNSYVFNPNQL